MSPEGPLFSPETGKDDTKDKKRKKKASVSLSPLVAVEGKADNKPETKQEPKREPNPIERMLAELAAKRAEKSAEESTEKAKQHESAEQGEVSRADGEAPHEADVEAQPSDTAAPEFDPKLEAEQTYEPLKNRVLSEGELNGGEVIILSGEEPAPRRAATAPAEHEPPQSTPDTVRPAYASQPTRPSAPEASASTSEKSGGVPPTEPFEVSTMPAESRPFIPSAVIAEQVRPHTEDIYQPEEGSTLPFIAKTSQNKEKLVTREEFDDAVYHATKVGQIRGVVSGLFLGGLYEHRKHKKREKRIEKERRAEHKEFDQQQKANHFEQQESQRKYREQERRFAGLERKLKNGQAEKQLPPRAENAPTEQAEQLKIPEDHRLEVSAWHSIEVDAKTGKAVENPTFQYGREYYKERAQETMPAQQRNAAAGEIALVAAAAATTGATQTTTPPVVPDASQQTNPLKATKKNAPPGTDNTSGSAKKPAATTSGPIWPWLVALAVIVVLLAILIH